MFDCHVTGCGHRSVIPFPVSAVPISVEYATADDSAIDPSDYSSMSGTLNFAANEATQTISVIIKGDDLVEVDETFFVETIYR